MSKYYSSHWHVFTYMDSRNVSCLISTSGYHWERDGNIGGSLNHWIIEYDDYLQPTKMLMLSNELLSVLTTKYFALFIASLIASSCSQQWWLVFILFAMHFQTCQLQMGQLSEVWKWGNFLKILFNDNIYKAGQNWGNFHPLSQPEAWS